MNLEQLEVEQRRVVGPVLVSVESALQGYKGVPVSESAWVAILRLLFELLRPAARQSALNYREFYDAERDKRFPGLGVHEVPLQLPGFARFVSDMEELKPKFMSGLSDDADVTRVKLRVARTIENSGRRTIIRAVEAPDPELASEVLDTDEFAEDDEPQEGNVVPLRKKRVVKGFARMATGRETCGWCWMLVSRGPVYSSMESAGFTGSFHDLLDVHNGANFDPSIMMNQWHDGCDCKVVPVWDLEDYPGKERSDAALELWKDVTRGKRLYGKQAVSAYVKAVREGRLQEFLGPALRVA